MSKRSLRDFADRVSEIFPVIMREFFRYHSVDVVCSKVTFPQMLVMHYLSVSREVKMSSLAKELNVTTAAMTGIVDRLFRDGYVARVSDPNDRRIVNIKLTSKGTKIMEEVNAQKRLMVEDIFGCMTEKDRADYLRILGKIYDSIKARKNEAK